MRGSTIVLLLLLVAAVPAARAHALPDRLERFREMATARLPLVEAAGERADTWAAELFALVDEEVLDSLRAGRPFASPEFIQERLDAFGGAWGGARFGIARMGGGAPEDLIGLFTVAGASSVRVYGRAADGPALLRTITHEGAAELFAWPPARDGSSQVVVAWVGPPSGHGTRALRLEVWRREPAGATLVWSTARALGEDVWVSAWRVDGDEIALRYELRYPGWKPGCEGQAEQQERWRWTPAVDRLTLARREVLNAWHRDLQSAVARFFAALAARDGQALADLVPDAGLRTRLPARLGPEPACEALADETPRTVVVAATETRDTRSAPWALTWRLTPRGWRLTAATPVLQ